MNTMLVDNTHYLDISLIISPANL